MIEVKSGCKSGLQMNVKGDFAEIMNDFSNIVSGLTIATMRDVESQMARKKIAEMMYLAFQAGMEHGVKAVEQEGKHHEST